MNLSENEQDKHRNRLKDFYNYIFTDKKKSEKYLQLFLKYLIPHKLLKLDKYEDDYNSFITHYRFNKDLWLKLYEIKSSRHIDWNWVKGHSGDIGNEKADFLANKGVVSVT